jgi:SSS family transporter
VTPLDWAVLFVYLLAIVSFGVYMGRGNKKIDDFFLAGRQMRWWAVGLSVMATQISAITFVGTTGQAYQHGMGFLVLYFGLPFAMVVLCLTVVPFFYRARVFTAYEYLEDRFDRRTRTLTSFFFLLSRGLSLGVTLYAPSLVLSVILGWSETSTILLMGISTILYVSYGGNKSVIWTDVVQMGIIWLGIFLCLGIAVTQLPESFRLGDALALAQSTGRLEIMNTSTSLTEEYTLWGGLFGGFFLQMAYFGTDQSQVQRYLSGSSLKQSRLSLLFNAFLKVPMQFMILLTGVLVFIFYHFHTEPLVWNPVAQQQLEREVPAPELRALTERYERAQFRRETAARAFSDARQRGTLTGTAEYQAANQDVEAVRAEAVALMEEVQGKDFNDNNYIFPSYIMAHLPRGLAGLVIAVIFAAAMSSLSGEFNSLATASMIDFYKPFVRPHSSDAHELLVSRLLTIAWGCVACLVALQAGRLGSAIEVVNRFGSYFYGSILGVFALAILSPRASARGAFYGLLIGIATIALVANLTDIHFLWYNIIAALTVFGSGSLISRLFIEYQGTAS